MSIDEFVSQLEGVKKNGAGFVARCPAHDDHTPSLSVSHGDKGLVLHCHAGCTAEAVVAAMGREMSDLFDEPAEAKAERLIVKTYDYTDERGEFLYQVVRFSPKGFAQRRPDGSGGWLWKLGDVRRVLYKLPDVLAAVEAGEPIYMVEGERDVETLVEKASVAATTNPGGAGKWRSEYGPVFRGATVVVVADTDETGRKHAREVVASLTPVTASVELVEPAAGKDATEHFAAGLGLEDFLPVALTEPGRVRTYPEILTEYARERSQDDYEPVRLGFGSIDADIRGISVGQVGGIGARTAVGKSWALATVEHNFAIRKDVGSLTLSLEMPGLEWAERAIGIGCDVAPEMVESWAKDGELGAHVGGFLERMENALVCDEPLGLDDLPAVFAEARARLNVRLGLVLIDYLGLLEAPGRDSYERASALGKGLKRVAKVEKVPIIVAMQLSRAGGDGSEPVSLQMLRDSGVLEESLDFLIGCWRPGKAANLTPPDAIDLRNVMRVQLLKNRKGDDGRVVDLRFRDESRQLYEPSEVF
jgi:hypothetical protein